MSLELPDENFLTIIGRNASGKTLFVKILRNLLSAERRSGAWSSHFESAKLNLSLGQESYIIREDFTTGKRESWAVVDGNDGLQGTSFTTEADGENGRENLFFWQGLDDALISQTFLVIDGNVDVQFDSELRKNLEQLVVHPWIAALARARHRLNSLVASSEGEGLLSNAEAELARAEERLAKFTEAYRTIEDNIVRRGFLEAQIVQQMDELRRLQQQRNQFEHRKRLQERLKILRNWLGEVAEERQGVEELRAQHVEILNRFEERHRPFRALPENFGESLAEIADLLQQRQTLSIRIEELAEARTNAEEELEVLRERRQQLEQGANVEALVTTNERATEIKKHLRNLRQIRSELEEKRDVKRQHLQEELGNDYDDWEDLCDKTQHLADLQKLQRDAIARRDEIEKRWLTLQEEEREQIRSCEIEFPNFDDLPEFPEEDLNRFYNTRNELRDAERRMVESQRQLAGFHRNPRIFAVGGVAFVTALVGFCLGLVLADWAVGLFASLVSSGALLTIFGRALAFPSRVRKKLEIDLQNHKEYWKSVLIVKDRLERGLGTLSNYPDFASAKQAFQDYNTRKRKLLRLHNSLAACEHEASMLPQVDKIKEEIASLLAALPEKLRAVSPEQLLQNMDLYVRVQREIEDIEARLRDYESEGEVYHEIQRLSAELSEMEAQEVSQSQDREQLDQEFAELAERERQFQAELAEDHLSGYREEIEELDRKIRQLSSEHAAFIRGEDPILLSEKWEEMVVLRAKLREIRDRLSACPTIEELKSREHILKTELDPLQSECSNIVVDKDMDLERFDVEFNELKNEIEQLKDSRDALPVSIEEFGYAAEDSEESLSAQLEERRQDYQELSAERDRLDTDITQIEQEIARRRETLPQRVLSTAKEFLGRLTKGKLREILVESDERFAVREASGRKFAMENLSGGERDLVMLALRIAMINEMGDLAPPIVFDDPFTRLDSENLSQVRELLTAFSQRHQVILLTRDSRYRDWGHAINLDKSESVKTRTTASG
ncbi:hypothetical protein KKB28_06610 [bacterium]|nr:hypothetical protein [bacterium]